MEKISGLGSIYYHSSKQRWVAQYTEDKNGVKKQKYIYGKTKDEVNRKLTEKQYNYHNDNYIKKYGIPLIKVLKQNREDKYAANLISDSHYSRLEFVLREVENSDIGYMEIDKITRRDLQNYFNSLISRYTDSTIKKIWEAVKQGFQLAIKEKYIVNNPFEDVLKPKSKKPTKIVDALSIEEQEILGKYLLNSKISQEKYRNALLLQLYTGMRIGEVLALTLDNIDFKNKLINVHQTISVDKEGYLSLSDHTKTKAGTRQIPISSFLEKIIINQLENYQENRYKVLFSHNGGLIKASSVNTVLKRICRKLDLPETISTHSLRHTFGTRCIESGMNPSVVQRLMGHNDIRVTLNTYTSVFNRYKETELQKAERYYLENNLLSLPDFISNTEYSIESTKNNDNNEHYFLR